MQTEDLYSFPDPETSDKQGLLAMGGDLEPQRILQAYSREFFLGLSRERPFSGGLQIHDSFCDQKSSTCRIV